MTSATPPPPSLPSASPHPHTLNERPRNPALDQIHLAQYTSREAAHERANDLQVAREMQLIREKQTEAEFYNRMRRSGSIASFGLGYSGYGNSSTGLRFRYVLPQHRRRPRPRQRELRVPKPRMLEQASEPEALVPIRLDVESEKHKLRDTFTWNAHETTVPLDWFAEILCEDFAIPPDRSFIQLVQKSIQEQLSDYHPHALNMDEDDMEGGEETNGEVDPALPYTAFKDDDMR